MIHEMKENNAGLLHINIQIYKDSFNNPKPA